MTETKNLTCPVCGAALCMSEDGKRLFCENRHSFDVARQGYVNLLSGGAGASTGDAKEMVDARTRFLESGCYEPFSDAVNRVIADCFADAEHVTAADAGCGEGYYTCRLAAALKQMGKSPLIYGFDLAKSACAHGAVKARGAGLPVSFFTASLFSMPLADGCCDAVINLFAPCAEEEFARVLKSGGVFLEAVPAERHLWEMKAAMYDTPYENPVRRDTFSLFEPVSVTPVRYTFRPGDRKDDLLLMTPYFWRTSEEGKKRLQNAGDLEITAAFDLCLYRKK